MTSQIVIGGVYLPSLLLLAAAAFLLTGVATGLLGISNAYRAVTYRPLVDLSLFVIILGFIALLTKFVT